MVDQLIKLKRNTSNTNAPDTDDIVVGELAIGAVAGKLYLRKSDDSILTFSDDTNVSTTLTIAADSGSNDTVTVGTDTLTYNGTSNQIGTTVSNNAITIALADDPVIGGTGSIRVPDGTTAQRPGSPAAGMFRYNTTDSKFEGYTDSWGEIGGGGSNTFTYDSFTNANSTDGNSNLTYTLSQTAGTENNLIVFIDGVFQNQAAFSLSGTTLTLADALTDNRTMTVYSVKSTVAGNNLNSDTMTGDGSEDELSLTISPNNKNNTQVFIDGVYQNKSTYDISGSTLTFTTPPPASSAVECMTFTQTDVNEATSVTASANNSTNETVYPTFVDGATGAQGIETDTGLTYNPSTGVLTSTSFAGQVTTGAQTNITSLLATDIKIGEDDQTKIDFETADEIHFYAANVEQIYLGDNIFGPQSDSDVDLGTTGVRWKDAFVDSITVTGEVDAASLDISGNADIDGTLEVDNLTIGDSQGSDGQLLTSTGSGVGWEDAPSSGTSIGKAIVLSMIFG